MREEPQPPSVFDPEITPEMDAIVLKALVKDPDYRYQSADEMRADIEACLDGQPVAATAAMGAVGYGGYPDDQPTTALRSDAGAGATSMLPPMNPDDGGYGYDDRQSRRRPQKRNNTSTILLVVAGVLVLIGAILIGRWAISGDGVDNSTVAAPNFVGETKANAQKLAANSELKLSFTEEPCEKQAKGNVCEQDPTAGTKVEKGDTVNLVVSTGAPKVAVPSVIGDKLEDAKAELEGEKYGFVVEVEEEISGEEPGTVIEQNPDLGEEVEKGTTVTLTVAKAEEKATVPDVVTKSCEEATAQMTANNLTGSCVEEETDDPNLVGKVIRTSPSANTEVSKGTQVQIFIGKAKAPEKVAVPKVNGQKLEDAQRMLAEAGLSVAGVQGPGDPNARVLGSNPPQDSQVDKGTGVTLFTVGGGGDGGIFG